MFIVLYAQIEHIFEQCPLRCVMFRILIHSFPKSSCKSSGKLLLITFFVLLCAMFLILYTIHTTYWVFSIFVKPMFTQVCELKFSLHIYVQVQHLHLELTIIWAKCVGVLLCHQITFINYFGTFGHTFM